MNAQLACLILEYQLKVREALVLMYRSGIRMPDSDMAWVQADIPEEGRLDGDVAYFKHGAGCLVCLPSGEVDFDFGRLGEIDGFDAWHLFIFSEKNSSKCVFESLKDLNICIEDELSKGNLTRLDDGLFYVASSRRELAVDIDCRLAGDDLPARNLDKVLVLHSHYFQAAELMLENYDRILRGWKKSNQLSQWKAVDLRIYMSSWLGFLAVTCEGFEKLRMRLLLENDRPARFGELIKKSDAVGKLIKRHRDSLRELRNKTFHLREDPAAVRYFFAPHAERLLWARELHSAFADFFSSYLVQCQVHYALNGRLGELRFDRNIPKKYKMW
jgi:hypothetical protein